MNAENFKQWLALGAEEQLKMPLVMGILNITPDSFSDGGKYHAIDRAFERAMDMIDQGADIIDIGAESSRPGAQTISAASEIERLKPLLIKLKQTTDICLSVDTCKPQVMKFALELGVDVINDISSLKQKESIALLQQCDVPICLMHQHNQHHETDSHLWVNSEDACQDVMAFFEERVLTLESFGINKKRLILDPGIGFGKVCQDNLKLIQSINKFQLFGLPLLLGVSRKSFIGKILDKGLDERQFGGAAVTAYAFLQGASIHRTHDIVATKDTLLMLKAILEQDKKND